ncbi:FkbM family methyltransferase [Teichococcus wenyumeiae]|nr:FkbM family methyltransferase [Pseudoroseomonas wenyumeiae]
MPHRTTEAAERLRKLEGMVMALTPPPEPPPVASAPPPATVCPLVVYPGYSEQDLAVFEPFRNILREPEPGSIVNFLGARMRTEFVSTCKHLDGKVLDLPVPDDGWHSEAIEWIGLLKSVLAAKGRWVSMELGAGWGPWSVGAAAAARHLGIKDIKLYAVEADPGHFQFLLRHMQDNGLDPAAHRPIQAAVGPEAGKARWPKVHDPADDWGSRPMEVVGQDGQDHIGRHFEDWLDVDIVAIGDLLAEQPLWDLVHIDVQGWEASLCEAAIESMNAKVRYVVAGTHDSKLHGDLMDLFFRHGWVLENEKPPRFAWQHGAKSLVAMTSHDGTQVWRNPALSSPA